ncbi:autotransporter outer membrane beta-barrel domain-containing protein [Campylobacter jejuni]|uniref:Autotransporter outer membrane beta-barrel domain-containing protein n=1 Tax=Campylobacter jejuni TaxID=197 RepID=A0A5Y6P114_CAMJU|nr:autotransporter outer membrane beta-barrel domain-containing protein [Campylobacter jejuni]EAJ2988492.1 autotransporter outer membrane beta-barrel domain-containing protein [Campylobacter jejuni]EAK2579515.1 autotransporter outer membrane beta-barrel domain-containing protein [Campylobacter jejuni]ECK7549794.1 autotransporter outer membrane beta-barrel domain-containing protein [Campylobacter jejuni]ECK8009143.1 autotransporter outer membrane beta-barrel domain-containing protein [Campylobac
MNKTALTKTYTKDIQNSCLNSKKIVLSLATISFLASCTHATLTPEIKTYEETNRHAKARSGLQSRNSNNETINNLQTSTKTISGTGNTLVIESSGTITISNGGQQAVNFQPNSSTSTFLNKGTLIGGNNTASVQLGANTNNGVTIETFDNQGIIGNGSSKFGVTVWGGGKDSSKSIISNFSNSGTIHSNAGESIYFGNANISSFVNSGTIKSQQGTGVNISQGTSSIGNFNNSGTIEGKSMGVNVRSTIDTFVNSGLITTTVKGNWSNGIQINANVGTLKNTGTIQGFSAPIRSSGGTIDQLINEGTMKGESIGIYMSGGLVKTLTNSGTINQNNSATWAAGIKLQNNSTIENIINTGSIHSNAFGISVTGGKFGTLTIKDGGQVYGKYSAIGVGQSQTLGDLYIDGSPSNGRVSGIYSEEHGILLENNSRTQKIELKNGGIIQGKIDGIRLTDSASLSGEMILSGEGSRVEGGRGVGILNRSGKITGSITIKDGATVTATSNRAIVNYRSGSITGGITVSGENTKLQGNIINTDNASIGSDIKIEGGAKVEGGLVNQGNGSISGSVQVSGGSSIDSITNEGNGAISGSITVDKDSKLDSITNTSTSSTGISGSITNNSDNKLEISNSGNIGGKIESTGSADMVISNSNGGTISGGISSSGSGSTSISNSQGSTINNGITVSGSAQVEISNQGSVGKDENGNTVTNNGSGSVGIKDWLVSTDKNTGKLNTVVIGGSGAFNVKVENITVDQSNVDLEELNDINNIISGVNQNNIGNIGTNGSGEISLSYDPITGKLTTDFNLNASISGATFRSLISTTSRRSTFIDNVMGNSMQSFALASSSKSQSIAMSEKGNLYADASDYIKSDLNNGSYGSNKEHSLFILPYTSSQNVELSLNEESKGHTKGTIIGYSTLKDSGIYGVYAGYEDTKMGSTYFDINNRTYYAGLKYFNTLFTTEKGQEVYIKAQGKAALIKNDLTEKIGNNEAKAEPNSYAYGVNTALGMNFISNKDIFSPEIGLAYEGGYTEAFSMKDTIGQATVKGGERTYANYLNLFSTKTSLTWFRDWLPNLKTSVELGAKFNINPKVEAEARFGNIKVSDEFDLPRVQKFVSTSFIVPVNEAFYFSLNYNGMFDKDGNTHTGFAQFNYLW